MLTVATTNNHTAARFHPYAAARNARARLAQRALRDGVLVPKLRALVEETTIYPALTRLSPVSDGAVGRAVDSALDSVFRDRVFAPSAPFRAVFSERVKFNDRVVSLAAFHLYAAEGARLPVDSRTLDPVALAQFFFARNRAAAAPAVVVAAVEADARDGAGATDARDGTDEYDDDGTVEDNEYDSDVEFLGEETADGNPVVSLLTPKNTRRAV